MASRTEMDERRAAGEISLAFVGAVLPDEDQYRSETFSRAGNMFQANLITALKQAGVNVSMVVSLRPLRSFPGGRRLWAKSERIRLGDGTQVIVPAFLNVVPLKNLMFAFAASVRLLQWGWSNRRAARRVVYTFNLSIFPAILTLAICRIIGARPVASVNDINVPGETVPNALRFRMDYWMQRRCANKFSALVIVAEAIRKDFDIQVPCVRVEGGVLERDFVDLRRREDAEPFVIASAGSLDEANGFLVLLEAFSLLKGDRYRLKIAGAGPLEAAVRKAAAVDPRIEYSGFIPFSDVLQLYGSADVLVNMRLTKTINTKYFFPSKFMEYLASGRPVVTTCTGHMEEEYGPYVQILRDETPEALAAALRAVDSLGPDGRYEMGLRGRHYMLQEKTWSAQGIRIRSLLLAAADSVGRPQSGNVTVA